MSSVNYFGNKPPRAPRKERERIARMNLDCYSGSRSIHIQNALSPLPLSQVWERGARQGRVRARVYGI